MVISPFIYLKGFMIQNDDVHIQTLMKLELTLLQAKTYLTLVKLGKAEVKRIAEASNVARPDVYRVMPALEKLGLAEKIVTNPTMYKATPIKEGYYILLQNKTQEHTELQQKTIDLIKNFHESNYKTTLQEEDQLVLIASKTLLAKKSEIEDSITKTSLDVIGEWKAVRAYVFGHLQMYKKAIKRGVKIRVVTEKHKEDKSMRKILLTFKSNPLFEIRYVTAPIPIRGAIYDGKKVDLSVRTSHDRELTPCLWSNNPQVTKVMTAYFEEIWKYSTGFTDPAIPKRRHKSAAKQEQTV